MSSSTVLKVNFRYGMSASGASDKKLTVKYPKSGLSKAVIESVFSPLVGQMHYSSSNPVVPISIVGAEYETTTIDDIVWE